MRGGFVACLGDHRGRIERAAERLRWHRGTPSAFRTDRLEIAILGDPRDGPCVESGRGSTLLVHGAPVDSLPALQRHCTRFAALHWDGAVLRATRDPMGLAPLFYRITDEAAWLATEIRALLEVAPNAPHLAALSARAGFAPIDEETGWLGIRRVLPGCTLEIDAGLGTRTLRYWDPARRLGTYRGGWREAVDEFRGHFRRAVARCYVPGSAVVLSGGQDSAAVAVSAPAGQEPPHLVHVHFPTLPRTQENCYAEAVADALGVPLHSVAGPLSPWDIEAELELHSAPYSWLPYGIDEAVQAHIRARGIDTALDGHDGDGVLGGHSGAWGELLLRGEFGRLEALARRYGANRAVRGVLSDFAQPALRPFRFGRTYLQAVSGYFCGDLRSRIRAGDYDSWAPSSRWRARQILPLMPRATLSFEHKELEAARHGIDLRHPFADRDLVDFLVSLPCASKSDPVRTKSLMMEALEADLPVSIRERPKSDYMEVIRHRVDPASCLEAIRSSNVRLPDVDYRQLLEHGDADPDSVPLFLLVNLARVHEFARRAR